MTASNKPPSIDMEPNENLANIGIYLQVFISNFIRTPETKGIWPTAIIHYRLSSVVRCFSLFEIIQISGQAPWPFKWCISDYVLFLLIQYIQCHYSTHSRYWNENDFTVDKLWFFCHFILMCFFLNLLSPLFYIYCTLAAVFAQGSLDILVLLHVPIALKF